jgi:hypothetical protein
MIVACQNSAGSQTIRCSFCPARENVTDTNIVWGPSTPRQVTQPGATSDTGSHVRDAPILIRDENEALVLTIPGADREDATRLTCSSGTPGTALVLQPISVRTSNRRFALWEPKVQFPRGSWQRVAKLGRGML